MTAPEYNESGDPQWIAAPLQAGGARTGDHYVSYGRWRDRLYRSAPSDGVDSLEIGRTGLSSAYARLTQALAAQPAGEAIGSGQVAPPVVGAMAATYDAMEWVHSLDEILREAREYTRAATRDAINGPYVEGLIGARNAAHHGLRTVIDVVDVAPPVYVLTNGRWIHSGTYSSVTYPSVRWRGALPPPRLRFEWQEEAFEAHLAGRDVRGTFLAVMQFFRTVWGLGSLPRPYGPAAHVPPIDLDHGPAS